MFLNKTKLCEKLKISRDTLYNWKKQGCPYKTEGKHELFNPTDVCDWLKKREVRANHKSRIINREAIIRSKNKRKAEAIIEEFEAAETKPKQPGIVFPLERIQAIEKWLNDEIVKTISAGDIMTANKMIECWNRLLDVYRKSVKDDLEVKKEMGLLVDIEESRQTIGALISLFKTGINDIADRFPQIVIGILVKNGIMVGGSQIAVIEPLIIKELMGENDKVLNNLTQSISTEVE